MNRNEPTRITARGTYREPKMCEIYSVSRSTLWRWAKAGRIPQPVRLSPGVTAWLASDVDAHLASLFPNRKG